ncbi:hypothetical protein ACFCZT_07675 [Streptomyces sp. NPDC056230]|uniref:hypothetical protein n=1 Tax=Streptomyces sp. NPDC056230 TaxID=3345754 RepID=UPI0035DC1676
MVELAKCDICGSDDDVQDVTIIMGDRSVRTDLCQTHAEPLGPIMDAGEEVKGARAGKKAAPARAAGHSVIPIEDIPELNP